MSGEILSSKYLEKDFQKDYWEENTNKRDINHAVVKTFIKQRFDYIEKYIDLSAIKNAFDVGCGDGFATGYLSNRIDDVEGGDVSELMLKNNPLPEQKLHVIDAEDLKGIDDDKYDLVLMWEVLHHLRNPEKAVREMKRISKEWIVIFEPNRANPLQFGFGLLNPQERGTLKSSKRYLRKMCEEAGINIMSIEYCGKIPPNKTPSWLLPIVSRLPFKSLFFSGISIAIIGRKK